MLEIVAEPLVEGAILAGAFRLERILGAGGMGVVWAARELATGRDVALKVLADDRATDPTQQARILREASAAMRIDHPNVVRVSAVLETEAGVPFLVMERLDGESLRAMLLREGRLEVDPCARIFAGVVDAVVAAHAAGILHRDLKPENVFLTRDGGVKVLDFGIAKRLARAEAESASLTETGAVIGTPYYMAPEQIFGDEDVDARADVWSLGVVLYECLAGRRPTEAEGFGPILKRITSEALEPLAALRPGLPSRWTDLVGQMLSRDRAARPSLEEVRRTLGLDTPATTPATAPPAAEAAPVSTARTADPPVVRPRGTAWRAAIALGLAAVGAVALSRIRREPSAKPQVEPAASRAVADPASLLLAASTHQAKRDGAACLRDLDAFDRLPAGGLPRSTELASGYGGVRATCMMLVGDCDAGRRLYVAWLPLHSPPMDAALFEQAAASVATQFCAKPR